METLKVFVLLGAFGVVTGERAQRGGKFKVNLGKCSFILDPIMPTLSI